MRRFRIFYAKLVYVIQRGLHWLGSKVFGESYFASIWKVVSDDIASKAAEIDAAMNSVDFADISDKVDGFTPSGKWN